MAITDEDITTRWDTAGTPNATLVMEADTDEADGDSDGTDGGDTGGTDGGDTGGTDGDADGADGA